MSLKKATLAAILLVVAIGMAGAMDYSAALNPKTGETGFAKPAMMKLGTGPFTVPDFEESITNAVIPSGDHFRVTNFRDVPALSIKTLEDIKPVSERK